jgi:hypothetical protein
MTLVPIHRDDVSRKSASNDAFATAHTITEKERINTMIAQFIRAIIYIFVLFASCFDTHNRPKE